MKQTVYVGPTIPGIVERNRVYRGELPKEVEEKKKENPYFANLFIPVDELAAARAELGKCGSVLAVSFTKVVCDLEGQKGRNNAGL